MKAWIGYALVSLAAVGVLAAGASLVLENASRGSILVSAVVAWTLQLVAFAVLLAVRHQPRLFMAGWAGGMGLRGLALGALAWAGSRVAALSPEPLLLSFVAFVFVLVLLEPVFLNRGRTR